MIVRVGTLTCLFLRLYRLAEQWCSKNINPWQPRGEIYGSWNPMKLSRIRPLSR